MQKITQHEANLLATAHERWLAGTGGKKGVFDYLRLDGLDFSRRNLQQANFRDASMRNTILTDANLWNADLHHVDMTSVVGLDAPWVVPRTGKFVGWKLCGGYAIAKLLIPADAKRSNGTSRKCRCDKALVLAVYDRSGREIDCAGSVYYSSNIVYRKGAVVQCEKPFDTCRWHEGTSGLHFFMTPEEITTYVGVTFHLPRDAYEGTDRERGKGLSPNSWIGL